MSPSRPSGSGGPPGSGGSNTLLVSYEYDALGRKFSATSANDVRYYDWANRLTSMTSGSGTLTADHDANGNMTRLGSDTLGWNVRGQLASLSSGGQSSTFGYDLYNRRSLLKLCGRRRTQALLRGFLLKTKTVVVLGNSGEVGSCLKDSEPLSTAPLLPDPARGELPASAPDRPKQHPDFPQRALE